MTSGMRARRLGSISPSNRPKCVRACEAVDPRLLSEVEDGMGLFLLARAKKKGGYFKTTLRARVVRASAISIVVIAANVPRGYSGMTNVGNG